MVTTSALAAADEIIIAVNPQLLAMMGRQDYLRTVTKIRRWINPKLKIAGTAYRKFAEELISIEG